MGKLKQLTDQEAKTFLDKTKLWWSDVTTDERWRQVNIHLGYKRKHYVKKTFGNRHSKDLSDALLRKIRLFLQEPQASAEETEVKYENPRLDRNGDEARDWFNDDNSWSNWQVLVTMTESTFVAATDLLSTIPDRPGIYEFSITKDGEEEEHVLYVGKANRRGRRGLRSRLNEYMTREGSHLKDKFKALARPGFTYVEFRYKTLFDPESEEKRMLQLFDYPWNVQGQ